MSNEVQQEMYELLNKLDLQQQEHLLSHARFLVAEKELKAIEKMFAVTEVVETKPRTLKLVPNSK